MKKSDRIWKHFLHISAIAGDVTRCPIGSTKYKKLNRFGWKLIDKYIEALNKEFGLK